MAKDNQVRFDSVEILSAAKTRAEDRVKLVNSLLEDDEIEINDLRKIQQLYSNARAEVNAGLERLLVEIETTGSTGEIEPYERIAERTSQRVSEFLSASDKMIFGKDRGVAEESMKLADTVVTALVDVWKTIRGDKTGRRDKLVQRIESLKWKPFEEIK